MSPLVVRGSIQTPARVYGFWRRRKVRLTTWLGCQRNLKPEVPLKAPSWATPLPPLLSSYGPR